MQVKFLKSAILPKEYPFPRLSEVAVVGRSNAGKSSFINALTGQKIAKVSGTPGKTRLLNFFELDDSVCLVDMPGYGFATGDRQEVASWKKMIETYLRERETLRGVFLIMDVRRDWQEEEEMLAGWLGHRKLPWVLIINKADKLSRSQLMTREKYFKKACGATSIFALSAMKKEGLDGARKVLFKEWNK